MKKIFFIVLIPLFPNKLIMSVPKSLFPLFMFLLTANYSYSQSSDYNIYQLQAIAKGNVIEHNVDVLAKNIINRMEGNHYDAQLKEDLREVFGYIEPLLKNDRWISVTEAEWRYKKAKRLYKKSLRKYKRRLKKNKNK